MLEVACGCFVDPLPPHLAAGESDLGDLRVLDQ